jgi:hypothetical protein
MGRHRSLRSVQRLFWREIARGGVTVRAAAVAGVSAVTGRGWFATAGGMSPLSLRQPSGRLLSLAEREQIEGGLVSGLSVRQIADGLGRAASTVSREVRRNVRPHHLSAAGTLRCGGRSAPARSDYRARLAQQRAEAKCEFRRSTQHLDECLRWWFLVLGVVWIWFGMFVLSYRVGSLAAVAAFVGVAFLFGGITQLVVASQVESWRWARARADRGSAPVADLSGGGAAFELAFAGAAAAGCGRRR